MGEEIINVNLYGGKGIFGGKETPLEASIIYCDKYESCSYFKNNQCLNVRAPFSDRCKHGKVSNVHGFTSRAAKYGEFKRNYQSHEKYGKLKYPPRKLGLIGSVVVFPYPHVRVRETENGELKLENPDFSSSAAFIDSDKFTVELIRKLCSFRPFAIMGGEITSYQKEVIPLFLAHLKEVMPEKYDEFTGKYENYSSSISYVGRKAFLKTVNPSCVSYISKQYPQFNEEWVWDGEILTRKKGYVSGFNITKDYEVEEIKLKPSDKSTITITSDEQVSEKTIFID